MSYSKSLYHYGIKGQHWGNRRYQNMDGSYTDEGKMRYFGSYGRPSGRPVYTTSVTPSGKITAGPVPTYSTTPTRPSSNTSYTHINVIDGKTTGAVNGQRVMGNGAPTNVRVQTPVKYNSPNGYQPSPEWKARMATAEAKYKANEAAKAAEAAKKAAEAAKKAEEQASGKKGKGGGSGKSKKSEEEKAAEKAAKEAEKEAKKKAKEEEKASKKSKDSKDGKTKSQDETFDQYIKRVQSGHSNDPRIDDVVDKFGKELSDSGKSLGDMFKGNTFEQFLSKNGITKEEEIEEVLAFIMARYKMAKHNDCSKGEYYAVTYSNSLSHHGIKGQRWGIRRYQNEDGSLTIEGRKRYGFGERVRNTLTSGTKRVKANKSRKTMTEEQKAKLKKGLMIGAAVVGTTAAAYLGYKYFKNQKALKTLMRDANSNISLGKSMVEKLGIDANTFETFKDDGSGNQVLSKKISYLGNDLKTHTASYKRELGSIHPEYFNPDVDTQREFATLKEYKRARKAAGLSNYVIGRRR